MNSGGTGCHWRSRRRHLNLRPLPSQRRAAPAQIPDRAGTDPASAGWQTVGEGRHARRSRSDHPIDRGKCVMYPTPDRIRHRAVGICAGLSLAMLLAGCAGMSENETAGTLVGGAAGAVLGSQFGKGDGKLFQRALRSHWGIENKLHWRLDVTFREDESRIRRGNGAHNIGVIRHVAMNLLKREKTKISYRKKRIRAALSDDFRDNLLTGQ